MNLILSITLAALLAVPVASFLFLSAYLISARRDDKGHRESLRAFAVEVFADLGKALAPVWCRLNRLWQFWGPRLCNRALLALLAGDVGLLSGGQSIIDFCAQHKQVAVVLVPGLLLMHLLTPLTPAGAPDRIPPPRPRVPGPDEAPRPQAA